MIFFIGDTHGEYDFEKLKRIFSHSDCFDVSKKDYVIICGDAGIIWKCPGDPCQDRIIKMYEDLPLTVLFIDGNHENHEALSKQHQIPMFGSEVGQISSSVFHLKRGCVYTIDSRKIFTFGGGYSIDKAYRTPYLTWWPGEMPNKKEYDRGLYNLDKHNNTVDYIVTHTCSNITFSKMYEDKSHYLVCRSNEPEEGPLRDYLDIIEERVKFKKWLFGHFHLDWGSPTSTHNCLYNNIFTPDELLLKKGS
jgi:predicted phosphodiesterase